MKWSILIATASRRNKEFMKLMMDFLPQIEDKWHDIEVVAYWNRMGVRLGDIRQALVQNARGEYICFVDDDDKLPDYYVDKIRPLLDGVDYIGWQMQLINNGFRDKPTFHSLKYANWYEDNKGYYRNISHLNPVRRDLALKADFRKQIDGTAEDASWAAQMSGILKTEHYIDDIMYYYHFDSNESLWRSSHIRDERKVERPYIIPAWKSFRYHPDSEE